VAPPEREQQPQERHRKRDQQPTELGRCVLKFHRHYFRIVPRVLDKWLDEARRFIARVLRYEGFPADQLLVFGDVLVELGELAVDAREIRARGSGGLLRLELCNRDLIVGDVLLELALEVLGRAKRAG